MSPASNPAAISVATPFLWATTACVAIIALMWPTAHSIINIWSVSETFTHGYFVIPAFIWLVWRNREELATLDAKPEWRVLLLVLVFGACWLLSRLSGIQVGEQVAFVLILICTLWAVLGNNLARAIQFPLLFLLFLAPVGEELVPVLMQLTADMTVWAIRTTGIPIYREGLFFSLPSGNWSVVEACSGIRYLIASLTLGTLYAYLSYSSYSLRILFIGISVIVPIFANSIRAYIIVMLGHFSDNKLATGVDHLIYGWIFFGIVMFALFSMGSLLKDKDQTEAATNLTADGTHAPPPANASNIAYISILLAALLGVGAWPSWAAAINSRSSDELLPPRTGHILQGGTLSSIIATSESTQAFWQPIMNGYDTRIDAEYVVQGNNSVRAMAFVYAEQEQGKEMINSGNVLVKSKDEHWRTKDSRSKVLSGPASTTFQIQQSILVSAQKELVVWQWYAVGDKNTVSPLQAKLMEVTDQLLFRKSLSVTYMLVADHEMEGWEKSLTEVTLNIVDKGK